MTRAELLKERIAEWMSDHGGDKPAQINMNRDYFTGLCVEVGPYDVEDHQFWGVPIHILKDSAHIRSFELVSRGALEY